MFLWRSFCNYARCEALSSMIYMYPFSEYITTNSPFKSMVERSHVNKPLIISIIAIFHEVGIHKEKFVTSFEIDFFRFFYIVYCLATTQAWKVRMREYTALFQDRRELVVGSMMNISHISTIRSESHHSSLLRGRNINRDEWLLLRLSYLSGGWGFSVPCLSIPSQVRV